MVSWVVFEKIVVVLAVVAVGWLVRRVGVFGAAGTAAGSRLVVDVSFPALVLLQIPRTTTAAGLVEAWPVVLGGGLLVVGGTAVGKLVGQTPTEAFLIGLPNWIFLPLLIAEGLYGDDGVRTILLVNVGAQLALWTVSVATLTGRPSLRGLLNPGLVATCAAVAIALALPEVAAVLRGGDGWGLGGHALVEAMDLLGQLAIPLALLTTGAQLAEASGAAHIAWGPLLRVVVGRLLLVPALATVALAFVGGGLEQDVRTLLVIIAAMPVALAGSLFSQRFGGDAALASRGVLVSTVACAGTVPLMLMLLEALGA